MGVSTTHRNNLSMWILIYSFSDTYCVWAACEVTGNLVRAKRPLEDKAKRLRLAGRGKRPNKARQVSEEEQEILWKSGKLGGTRIFNSNRLNNSKNFSARFCSMQILKTSLTACVMIFAAFE